MTIVIGILTFLEVIVCLLLCLLVLMQRPRQEGLGATFGTGMTDQMFGAQTTNVLQKGTVYFGIALFVLTFLLAVLTAKTDEYKKPSKSLLDSADKKAKPTATTPAASELPAPAGANKDATPATAPAKTEPAKAEDKKPAEAKPEAAKPAETKPAAPKPAETKPAPAAAAPAPTPAPAPAPAATKPAESTPPAPATEPKPEEKK